MATIRVSVQITETREYEVQHVETDERAKSIVQDRVNEDAPIGLLNTKREVTNLEVVPDDYDDSDQST